MKRRIIYWAIGLALVGALLATKRMEIHIDAIFIYAFWGGIIGAVIGFIISKISKTNK